MQYQKTTYAEGSVTVWQGDLAITLPSRLPPDDPRIARLSPDNQQTYRKATESIEKWSSRGDQ
jgi:hypothetical protein